MTSKQRKESFVRNVRKPKKMGGKQLKLVVLLSSFNSYSRVIEVHGLQVLLVSSQNKTKA